jgi:LysM repeat protein
MASSVKVKSGDTLSQIAKSKGVTLQALLAANPDIKNANMIRVGQTIKMPKANSVPGNTKGSPYGRMSQTQMNMLKGTKDQQRAVTSALRSEVSRSGAQTTPTPKKARETLNAPFNELRERVLKNKPKKKPSSNSGSMSGLRDDDVAAKKGGYMKKYKSGGKTSSEENRLTKLGRAKKPRSQQGNSMANDVTTSLGRTRADMEAVARGGVKAKNKGGIMRGAGAATRGKKFGRCG